MIDVSKVEKLMALMREFGVDVIQAESREEKISLARNAGNQEFFNRQSYATQMPNGNYAQAMAGQDAMPRDPAQSSTLNKTNAMQPAAASPAVADGTLIKSPFVGNFYRSPGPDSPSFVEKGSRVRKGQTLCIVEAMKLMNEIESELDGEVVDILIENGKTVEFGTPLFVIK